MNHLKKYNYETDLSCNSFSFIKELTLPLVNNILQYNKILDSFSIIVILLYCLIFMKYNFIVIQCDLNNFFQFKHACYFYVFCNEFLIIFNY